MFMFIWHLSFAKSLSLFIFLIVFLCQGQTQRFAMSFNGLFCQVLVAFRWVPIMNFTEKKYTYICEEHSDRASNKVFFVCPNLVVKVP